VQVFADVRFRRQAQELVLEQPQERHGQLALGRGGECHGLGAVAQRCTSRSASIAPIPVLSTQIRRTDRFCISSA
jgi:hypothetical protein